jgi:hypothetical protein
MATPPLTAAALATVLDILEHPEHPAFAQALTRLDGFDPSILDATSAPPLLARLAAILEKLTAESKLTATQLTQLRRGNKALQSYGNL